MYIRPGDDRNFRTDIERRRYFRCIRAPGKRDDGKSSGNDRNHETRQQTLLPRKSRQLTIEISGLSNEGDLWKTHDFNSNLWGFI